MFTGIIESIGRISRVTISGGNKTFWIESPISNQLKVDQSVSHDGVCLTIEEVKDNCHRVTAIEETLKKSNLRLWGQGQHVNLERSLKPDSRLDGHFVQGHVDTTAVCVSIKEKHGSHEFEFNFPKKFSALLIEKGSIAINGISLTAFDVKKKSFKVAIVPYTWDHTNLRDIRKDDVVNIEFDLIGKYITGKIRLKQ